MFKQIMPDPIKNPRMCELTLLLKRLLPMSSFNIKSLNVSVTRDVEEDSDEEEEEKEEEGVMKRGERFEFYSEEIGSNFTKAFKKYDQRFFTKNIDADFEDMDGYTTTISINCYYKNGKIDNYLSISDDGFDILTDSGTDELCMERLLYVFKEKDLEKHDFGGTTPEFLAKFYYIVLSYMSEL